jgi:hypothetical protein
MADPKLRLLEDAVGKLVPFFDGIIFGVTLGLLITNEAAAPHPLDSARPILMDRAATALLTSRRSATFSSNERIRPTKRFLRSRLSRASEFYSSSSFGMGGDSLANFTHRQNTQV